MTGHGPVLPRQCAVARSPGVQPADHHRPMAGVYSLGLKTTVLPAAKA